MVAPAQEHTLAVYRIPASEPGLFDVDNGESISQDRKVELVELFDAVITKPDSLKHLEGWREPAEAVQAPSVSGA